jgi:predicted dehydrogenase
VETDDVRRAQLHEQWQVPVFSSADDFFRQRAGGRLALDAASVCVPTSAHSAMASQIMEQGLDVLVEKPIAASLAEADALVRQAAHAGRVLQVGHLERFNPAVSAVEPLLNRPMFFEAHRLSVFTHRSLDVDVVLDLMIHDLDVVLHFVRSPVTEVRAVGLPILSSRVDIANVRLQFESGAVANFTASRASTEKVRKLRFFQPHEYVSLDFSRRDVLVIRVAENLADGESGFAAAPQRGLTFSKPDVKNEEPLRLEIEAFLEAVRHRSQPKVSADQGRDVLALALRINEEMKLHNQRAGLDRFRW